MNKKYKLAVKIIVVVIAITIAKLLITSYTDLTISLSPLFISMVGGTIFLMGFLLAGVVSDYKESEKIPGEIASSIENVYEESKYVKSLNGKFNLEKMKKSLVQIVDDLKNDIGSSKLKKKSVNTVSKISDSLLEMEKLKIPAAYITRIKTDRDGIKKNILRVYHIKETSFVPAAYAILEILAAGIILILLFIKIEPFLESVLIPGLITFFLLYMIALIKDMDDPYDVKESYVAVDLFLLDDVKNKIEKGN